MKMIYSLFKYLVEHVSPLALLATMVVNCCPPILTLSTCIPEGINIEQAIMHKLCLSCQMGPFPSHAYKLPSALTPNQLIQTTSTLSLGPEMDTCIITHLQCPDPVEKNIKLADTHIPCIIIWIDDAPISGTAEGLHLHVGHRFFYF